MTKNDVFIRKGYCNQGLFVLNVSEMNNNAYTSAYLIDFYNIWHARLGHVSMSYIKKIKALGLISNINMNNLEKCHICAETKQTKKIYVPVSRKSGLLELIHTDLGDLK